MLNAIKPSKKTVILYLLVPVVLFIFTVFVPLVTALVYSFFEWKGGPKKTFIGIANYKQLFQDGVFWQALSCHRLYHRSDRYCLCSGSDDQLQTGEMQRRSPYLRIFPEYHFSRLYRFDLEHDLSQQIRYSQLVLKSHRKTGSLPGMAE